MNRPDYRIPSEYRIPEDQAQEVFTRAAQLYAQHNQSYSVKELMEAGSEARIPPEFIQQAIEELQIQQSSAQKPVAPSQTKKLVVGLAIALPLLAAIAGIGWLLARNAATNAQQKPVQTEQPIAVQPPLAQPVSNFCAGLNLAGQNLSGQNLSNANCPNANFANAILSNTNLQGSKLQSSNLSKANLNGANLQGTDLRGADLTGADLANANLSGANLEGANLSKTDLRGANLKNANINRTDLAGAQLEGANVDLSGAKQ
ncbi:MAG: hypothetical protein Fur006_24500 [Coleofasciculaceae cyanobacterium]